VFVGQSRAYLFKHLSIGLYLVRRPRISLPVGSIWDVLAFPPVGQHRRLGSSRQLTHD
jgi:hypothetical protein